MKAFPIMVTSLVILAGVMWARLDFEQLGSNSEGELLPYEIFWHPWEPGLVESARDGERVVWLQFTAEWSLTVLLNEKRLLADEDFQKKLAEHRVFLIKADMTDGNRPMREELQKYGEFPVPTNLFFPADPDKEMTVLLGLLTPEIAIEALDRAAGK